MTRKSSTLPTTDWVLVESAAGPSPRDAQAIQTLLLLYLPALRDYVIYRWNASAEQAEDWLQEFLSIKVVEEKLFGQARRELGSFRLFLKRTLNDFVISQLRRERAKKRSPVALFALESAEQIPDPAQPAADAAFQVAWARELIANALRRMEAECKNGGRNDLWGLFKARILGPIMEGSPVPPYEGLVTEFGFQSPLHAANALVTAKRMFERNLRSTLGDYVQDEGEIDQELRELRSILATGGL